MTDRQFEDHEQRLRELEEDAAQTRAMVTLLRFGLPVAISLVALVFAILSNGGK